MGISDHLTCILWNLLAGQEAAIRTRHGPMDWLQIRKGVHQAVYCHPAYLTYMQSISCEMPGWMQHKLESRLLGEILVTSDMRWHHHEGRKWRGITEPLDEGERGEWKSWLKTQPSENKDHGIQSHYFMANIWGNNRNSDRLYFLGLRNHCGQWLPLWN